MYSNGLNLNPSSYSSLIMSPSGTISVPVKPNAVLYSQFDYIHGISSGSFDNGVSVNKIRILNTLLTQLATMKKNDALDQKDLQSLTDQQKDSLIQQYQQKVKDSMIQAQETGYGLAGTAPEAGLLFSISA